MCGCLSLLLLKLMFLFVSSVLSILPVLSVLPLRWSQADRSAHAGDDRAYPAASRTGSRAATLAPCSRAPAAPRTRPAAPAPALPPPSPSPRHPAAPSSACEAVTFPRRSTLPPPPLRYLRHRTRPAIVFKYGGAVPPQRTRLVFIRPVTIAGGKGWGALPLSSLSLPLLLPLCAARFAELCCGGRPCSRPALGVVQVSSGPSGSARERIGVASAPRRRGPSLLVLPPARRSGAERVRRTATTVRRRSARPWLRAAAGAGSHQGTCTKPSRLARRPSAPRLCAVPRPCAAPALRHRLYPHRHRRVCPPRGVRPRSGAAPARAPGRARGCWC